MLVYNSGQGAKNIIKSATPKQTRPKKQKKIRLSNKIFLKSIGLTLVEKNKKNGSANK